MLLVDLAIGEKGVVKNITHDTAMKRRLWDLGFTKGTVVEAIQKSPSGDPIAYKVRGTIFAIRNKDAQMIEVSKLDGE